MKKEKQKAFLDNWLIRVYENGDVALSGVVSGHPKLPNQEFITTSCVVKFEPMDHLVETMNTIYELGMPCARGIIDSNKTAYAVFTRWADEQSG